MNRMILNRMHQFVKGIVIKCRSLIFCRDIWYKHHPILLMFMKSIEDHKYYYGLDK